MYECEYILIYIHVYIYVYIYIWSFIEIQNHEILYSLEAVFIINKCLYNTHQ